LTLLVFDRERTGLFLPEVFLTLRFDFAMLSLSACADLFIKISVL